MSTYSLYQGDCLSLLPTLPPDSVDMFFTDLPYGTTRCHWDTPIDLKTLWCEVNRVVKPNGAMVLFAQTPFDKVLGASNLQNLRYEWIWEKTSATGHLNAGRMPLKAHENLLVFYRRLPTYHPQKTHNHPPIHTNTKSVDAQNRSPIYGNATRRVSGGGETDRFPRSVLRGPSDKQTSHLHPTQKPVWLCQYMIRTYTNHGDTVLDCCMGSASIGVACLQEGRHYIGMDNDTKWFAVATERLSKVIVE